MSKLGVHLIRVKPGHKCLASHNPFSLDTDNNLRKLMNGVNADSGVSMLTQQERRGEDGIVKVRNVSHRLLIQTKCPGRHYGIEGLHKD